MLRGRRREYLAPPPFWLFLPPPQKRKKYILKISKNLLCDGIVEAKETHYEGKKDLLWRQKRPTMERLLVLRG